MKVLISILSMAIGAHAQLHWKSERENGAAAISIRALGERSGVAIAGYGRVLKTSDGGETWTNAGGPISQEITSSCFLDSSTGWMLSSTFGHYRVYRTSDGGSTWSTLKDTSGYVRRIHFSDRDNGWGVGWRSIRKSTDGGSSWKAVAADTTVGYSGVFFVNASTGWVARDDGRLIQTRDGGLSWKVQDSASKSLSPSMQFLNEDTGWIGINSDTVNIQRTADGGRNWTRIKVGDAKGIGGFHFINSKTGWFASADSAGIYRTDDGGLTWTRQWKGSAKGFTSIHFSDAARGFAAGSDGIIVGTVDGGTLWTLQNSVVPILADVQIVTPKIGWAVGYDKIVKTINGGINWIPQKSGLPPNDSYLKVVRFADTSMGWAGGKDVILKTAD